MPDRAVRGRTKARRLLNSVLASPWFVKRDWLQEFAGLAEEARIRGDDLTAGELRDRIRSALASLAPAEAAEAIAIDYGESLGEGLRATVRDGVAIIPIMGPLYHYASEFDDVCGCSSYEQIARDLNAALESPAVASILLEVDSPGGEVAGCGELAHMIFAARETKPITAYVSAVGCSAAYYLAAAAAEVVIARAAIVGSIGVVMSFTDTSERDAKSGVRRFEILSSQSPRKRADPNTEAGRAEIQQMLDDLGQVFIEDVAAFRGVPVETVLADFGQGGVMVGARAVTAGLADRLGSFEGELAALAELATASHRGTPAPGGIRSTLSGGPTMAKENETATPAAETEPATPTPVTAESISTAHPEIEAEIRRAAATAERDRILGIEELALKGQEALVAECKRDASCTPEAFAVRQTQAIRASGAAEGEGRQRHLRALATDEGALDAPAPSTDQGGDSEEALARSIAQAGQVPAVTG